MTTRVMVTLQDDVYRRVERLAQLTSRDVADLLADTITLALQPLAVSAESVPAITSLSDEEVLEQHLDSLRRKDSLRGAETIGAETTEISVCLENYFASHFEGA